MKDFIKQSREKLGLTQIEFAKKLNVSVQTVQAWEQGKRNPRPMAIDYIKSLVSKDESR